MATDATGTPTSKGIPKYNPSVDAPSGLGFNAAMDAIDTLLDSYVPKPASIATGEVPVWNGSAFARSSVTRISTVRPQDLGQDGAVTGDAVIWDGSKWAPAVPSSGWVSIDRETASTDVTNTASETTLFTSAPSVGAGAMGANGAVMLEMHGDALVNIAGTLTLRVKFGGTAHIVSGALDLTDSATRTAWFLRVLIENLNATNSQRITAILELFNIAGTAAATGTGGFTVAGSDRRGGVITNTATIDTTSAQTLDVTAQWSTNSTSLSFRKQFAKTLVWKAA